MASDREIAITGMGLITSLGATPEQTWLGLMEGRIGIGPIDALEQSAAVKGGSQAVDLPTDLHDDLPRASHYLRHAISHALHESGALNRAVSDRVGVMLGTTLHGMRAAGEYLRTNEARRLQSFLGRSVLDRALRDLQIAGPRVTTCSACSSGLSSVALGATMLRAGQIDAAVCGGYDTVSEYAYAGFDSLRLVDDRLPTPFGAERQGMKVGEGYGVIILERAADAVRHGADILAILAGIGESSDAFHLTQPHPEGQGAAQAMRLACANAGLTPDKISMVSAHGTATPNNDASEYAALAAIFGAALPSVPVVALKSHLGHTLGGAGAVELILSVLALRNQRIPFTAHTRDIDPQFVGLNLVRERPIKRNITTTMNLSLGFGGANTCVILSARSEQSGAAVNSSTDDDEPVITGLGVILPSVVGCDAFRTALKNTTAIEGIGCGPIPEASFAHLVNARRTRRMSEYAKLTLASASAACQDAGVLDDGEFLGGCSAILGTTHGASLFCETYYAQIVREGLAAANPVLFAEGVPNAAAAHLSMMLGIRGGCQTIIGSRSAGLDALMLGRLRIRQGSCSRMIISAAEEHSTTVNAAYRTCNIFDNNQPFLTGSGSVSLVLESRRSARLRGAPIHAAIGRGAWQSNPNPRAGVTVLQRLEYPPQLICALGRTGADQLIRREIGAQSPATSIWSIRDHAPELFSVGPLAALIAWLFTQSAERDNSAFPWTAGPFAILASEFSGASSAVLIEPPAPTSESTTAIRDTEAKIR